MKRLTILLIILPVFISSCQEEPKKIDYTWIGKEEIRHLVPVCIIWYKQVPRPVDAWRPYKAFSQTDANEMREIILQLLRPEEKEPNPGLRTNDKLSMIFYNGLPEKLTVREVYFEIKDKTFVGPVGKSVKLAKILSERQEVRSLFYYPYLDLGPGYYSEDFPRIMDMYETNLLEELKRIREEAERGLLILYRENADPNEIRQLKKEWWEKTELEYTKHSWADLNEIRRFKEDWWGKIEENINRSRKNTGQNRP